MSSADIPPFDSTFKVRKTLSPNPQWTYGQKIEDTLEGKAWMEGEKEGWTVVDTGKADPMTVHTLMISGIVPRPIALVCSISEDGVENLSPFSWFNMVTDDPPLISISCINGPARVKDTTNNIRANKGFTANMINEPWAEAANVCSVNAPTSVSEWPISGLTKVESVYVKPSRIKESSFSMECEVRYTFSVGTTLLLSQLWFPATSNRRDCAPSDGREHDPAGSVDPALFKPVARMGKNTYTRGGDVFELRMPMWAQEAENIQKAMDSRPE